MKLVDKVGRIHGDFQQVGTVTRRFTHMKPNMSQVPSCDKPFGHECRELFYAPEGYVMVGIDASGLETRLLAGYLKQYDKGNFEYHVLSDDIHQYNAGILGSDRPAAKEWYYAFLYGAGIDKLQRLIPGSRRQVFEESLPGFTAFKDKLKSRLASIGHLMSLDGCPLKIRKAYRALNTLLQSAGSILMKKALKIFDDRLQHAHLRPGEDYEFVNNIHDEWQLVVKSQHAELVGQMGVEAIRKAGEVLKFPTPMDGEYKIGRSWAETH
jgi:DNA polymerase I-like protein with 3'-5' exonuclease and polymerase domains